MGNTHASHKLFEKLDVDQSGGLNLQEILDASNISRNCSLLALFHFDVSREGIISRKEFETLDRFLQSESKKVKKRMKHSQSTSFSSDQEQGANGSASASTSTSGRSSVGSRETASSKGESTKDRHSKDVTLPPSSRYPFERDPSSARMQTTYKGPMASVKLSDSEQDILFQKALKSQVNVDLQPLLDKEIFGPKGRAEFLEWLFRLANTERDGKISLEDLRLILLAVEKDGISLRRLAFEAAKSESADGGDIECKEDSASCIAERVMQEFDVGRTGYLTKDEFLVLGDLILREYQGLSHDGHFERIADGRFCLTNVIGEGSYGVVRHAFDVERDERRAVKILPRGNVSDMARIDTEIQAMKTLKHVNVVRLYDVVEEDKFVYLIMELCGGGTLMDLMESRAFTTPVARGCFRQLIEGLAYCHGKGVCHRDLRLENLLIGNDGTLKITDFGQARLFGMGWDLFSTQLVGSLYNISPEQIEGKCFSGQKIDIWSAGIILYYMLTGDFPFAAGSVSELFAVIRSGEFRMSRALERDPDALRLIRSMLSVDPEKRPWAQDILSDKWLDGPSRPLQLIHYRMNLLRESDCAILEGVVRRLGIHVHYGPGENSNQLRCHFTQKSCKFVLLFFLASGGTVDASFVLHDGESRVLRMVFYKVRRLMQTFFPGSILPDYDEHNDDWAEVTSEGETEEEDDSSDDEDHDGWWRSGSSTSVSSFDGSSSSLQKGKTKPPKPVPKRLNPIDPELLHAVKRSPVRPKPGKWMGVMNPAPVVESEEDKILVQNVKAVACSTSENLLSVSGQPSDDGEESSGEKGSSIAGGSEVSELDLDGSVDGSEGCMSDFEIDPPGHNEEEIAEHGMDREDRTQ